MNFGERPAEKFLLVFLCVLFIFPAEYVAGARQEPLSPDSTEVVDAAIAVPLASPDSLRTGDILVADSIAPTEVRADDYPYGLDGKRIFNPSPTRAVWLSALCPGLGQIYNRRYWKLPVVVGGFMGLGYATSWNNDQYQAYVNGYRDLVDSDPATNSYMDFFPPTVSESDIDKTWMTQVFKSRRDYYRRYRDLCIILIAAFYLICMVDAYVDASMAHFDISPTLSMDISPALLPTERANRPALGLNWAFTF